MSQYFVINQTDDNIIVAGNGEAFSVSIANKEALSRYASYPADAQVREIDDEAVKTGKKTYGEAALGQVSVRRYATTNDISFDGNAKGYNSITDVVADIVKPYKKDAITQMKNLSEYDGANMMKTLQLGMKRKAVEMAKAELPQLEAKLKSLANNGELTGNEIRRQSAEIKERMAQHKRVLER